MGWFDEGKRGSSEGNTCASTVKNSGRTTAPKVATKSFRRQALNCPYQRPSRGVFTSRLRGPTGFAGGPSKVLPRRPGVADSGLKAWRIKLWVRPPYSVLGTQYGMLLH